MMQHKSELARSSAARRLRSLARSHAWWLQTAAGSIAGFIMAKCFIFSGVSPFAAALCAALSGLFAIGAAAGAIVGYALSATMLANVKYIVAVILVICAKNLFGKSQNPRFALRSPPLIVLVALGIANGASLFLYDATLYDLIIATAETLLGCGAAYFFARSVACIPAGWKGAGRTDISCVAVSACTVLMGLSNVGAAGISLGRTVGILLILLCARFGAEGGGSACGIAAGGCLGLVGGNLSYLIGAYGFGGLVAGMFSHIGRIATAAAFIVINTAIALLTLEYNTVTASIYEAFVASVLFVAIPDSWIAKIQPSAVSAGNLSEVTDRGVVRDRLEDFSGALSEIGAATRAVSQKLDVLDKRDDNAISHVCDRVVDRVCAGCGMKSACWELRLPATTKAFNISFAALRKEGMIRTAQMPRHFQRNCCRMDDLVAELNTQFQAQVARDGVQRKVGRVRAVVTEQFEGMAAMLREIAAELGSVRPLDPARTQRVLDYFDKQGFGSSRVVCSVDRFGRLTIDVTLPNYRAPRLDGPAVALDLCDLLEIDFDPPQIIQREKTTAYYFFERAAFSIETGVFQLSCGKNRYCGDTYDLIRNKNGWAHLILSDGMGSGGGAAVDSSMTCALLSRLVSVGASYETALGVVNSALLVKSGDESLATVDICSLDLFTGKAVFYKAGAAPSFLVKSGTVGLVDSVSLPAGIIHGVSFEKNTVMLRDGDIVVMVSDGVVATGVDWLKSEISDGHTNMQQLCEKVAHTAKMRRGDGHEDDVTVLAAKLIKA